MIIKPAYVRSAVQSTNFPDHTVPTQVTAKQPKITSSRRTRPCTRKKASISFLVYDSPLGQPETIDTIAKRNKMVLGLLVLTAIPTVTGVAQGISSKKQENAAMKEKIKFNMTAVLSVDGGPPTEAWIVLRDGRVSGNTCFLLLCPPPLPLLAALSAFLFRRYAIMFHANPPQAELSLSLAANNISRAHERHDNLLRLSLLNAVLQRTTQLADGDEKFSVD